MGIYETLLGYIAIWKGILLSPSKSIPKECKRNAGIAQGIWQLLASETADKVVTAAILLAYFLFIGFAGFSPSAAARAPILAAIQAAGLLIILFYIALVFLAGVVALLLFSFLNNGLYYISAKMLGGKGKFNRQFYAISAETSSFIALSAALTIPSVIIALIPCAGALILIAVTLGMFIYDSYLKIHILSQVHSINTMRAIVVWAIPMAIVVLLLLLAMLVFGAMIMAIIAAAMAARPPAPA